MFLNVPATLEGMNEREPWEVGQIVARRRARLRMDAAELAGSAGVDPKTLRSLERGERWPRDGTLRKIEQALQWEPGALDSIKSGGSAVANFGLAAVDELGEELFYVNPKQVDVPENTKEEAGFREVMRDLTEIAESMDRQPDSASAIAERRIRSAGKLLDSAAKSLERSDKTQAIDDLDASVVVIRSTITKLQKETTHANDTTSIPDRQAPATGASGPKDEKIKPDGMIDDDSSLQAELHLNATLAAAALKAAQDADDENEVGSVELAEVDGDE